uniref:Uncharacterized protein n=1 Tax=Oncorhynchus tshawytscha TaxID=74940 RepID=A0AAZ3S0Q8_ONCTS
MNVGTAHSEVNPQHAGDEQPGHLALLHPGHRPVTRHPAQHPLR